MAKYCPDCGTPIGSSKCSCGWVEVTSDPEDDEYSGLRCEARGCPMPVVVTDSIRGGGRGYCWWHSTVRYGPSKWDEITRDLIENPPEPLEDWRDKLMKERNQ